MTIAWAIAKLFIFLDNATSADVAEWMEPITSAFEDITGRTHVFLDGTRTSCRLKECNLGKQGRIQVSL